MVFNLSVPKKEHMTVKLGRNQPCHCGSNKKFKHCHGSLHTPPVVHMKYIFTDVRFRRNVESTLELIGNLYDANSNYQFNLLMTPLEDGEWKFERLHFNPQPENLIGKDVAQSLINKAATLVKTINMWSGEQSESGAKVFMNEKRLPDDAQMSNAISFRSGLLDLPVDHWSEIWDRIDSRVLMDDFFRVHGFSQEEVLSAIEELKLVFPSDWVKARYAAAKSTGNPPKLGDVFSQEEKSWFPAYHLARTALGAICVDPGWNYLVEIGLSIQELEGFDGVELLKRKLTSSSGTQHHLCLAAELYKRGFLIGLEPPTGAGSATNDLSVLVNENHYAIEVKELTSGKPFERILKLIKEKSRKTPETPSNPVVFHVVLREEEIDDVRKEKEFLDRLQTEELTLPKNISAIVVGSRFVDAMGGRVKRRTNNIILNSEAKLKASLDDLNILFENNYSDVIYPCYGIGTFFYFENRKEKP